VSDWFFMLGEALDDSECRQAQAYLQGLGIGESIPVVGVPNWQDARRTIADPAWDHRWWDAEQEEKRRLMEKAKAALGDVVVMRRLSESIEQVAEAMHGDAAVEAARRGCTDTGLIRAAAGSAAEAFYLAALARLTEEGPDHPFAVRQTLFAGGHWPLGIVQGRYHVF